MGASPPPLAGPCHENQQGGVKGSVRESCCASASPSLPSPLRCQWPTLGTVPMATPRLFLGRIVSCVMALNGVRLTHAGCWFNCAVWRCSERRAPALRVQGLGPSPQKRQKKAQLRSSSHWWGAEETRGPCVDGVGGAQGACGLQEPSAKPACACL